MMVNNGIDDCLATESSEAPRARGCWTLETKLELKGNFRFEPFEPSFRRLSDAVRWQPVCAGVNHGGPIAG
jgi:hypothetical protein